MLIVLDWILSTAESFGILVEWAIVSVINLVFVAMATTLTGVFSILPHMSDAPVFGTPEWLAWLNWFYPVGAIVSAFASLLFLYTGWLVVRWVLNLLRAA
jgi:hypothetical protein